MKIAIIGGTGLLGSNLVKLYSKHDVKSFSRRHFKNVPRLKNIIINFDDLNNDLSNHFDYWKPHIIINTIAIVNLQKCEDNFENANYVNCDIALKLSNLSKKYNSYFIHLSTDHYYDDNAIKHSELDEITLKNNYSITKYNAENAIKNHNNKALIVRTNIIGFRGGDVDSFFEWLIKSLKNNIKINLYQNYYTSPISVLLLGKILLKCYEKDLSGIYNIASSVVIDKYNFGLKVANKFGFSNINIKSTKFMKAKNEPQRALTLGLDVSKIESALNEKMPSIDDNLNTLYVEYIGFNEPK